MTDAVPNVDQFLQPKADVDGQSLQATEAVLQNVSAQAAKVKAQLTMEVKEREARIAALEAELNNERQKHKVSKRRMPLSGMALSLSGMALSLSGIIAISRDPSISLSLSLTPFLSPSLSPGRWCWSRWGQWGGGGRFGIGTGRAGHSGGR